ncbi:MAG: dipeptidase [Hyphomicrobiaceae bacterium]
MKQGLHSDAIVIDGLIASNWGRPVFESMHQGGLTAANCTCSYWESFRDTMRNIGQWYRWFSEYSDIIMPVYSTADIKRAKTENKVGIVLGFQNTSAIEDQLDALGLFKQLGVGVMQLTYNTQNFVGSGCWEDADGGLTGFGREVVEEMNHRRIVIDLSHTSAKTAEAAIHHSRQPVAYSHICPAGLFSHARNKTDEQMREIVKRGGFVGVATYPPFMAQGKDATLDDAVTVFEYVINICGEENVGIGTDMTQGQDAKFFDWLRSDKGYARRMVSTPGRTPPSMPGMSTLADYGNLTAAFERRGWSERRIRGVLGENWLRFLGDVWGGATSR